MKCPMIIFFILTTWKINVEHIIKHPVISDAMMHMWPHCNVYRTLHRCRGQGNYTRSQWCQEGRHDCRGNRFVTQLTASQWRHNGCDDVSNHQHHHCLLNRLFRRRSKKTSKLRVTSLCAGNSPVTGEFPAQWPATRKMFSFDDVIKAPGCFQ